VAIWLVFLAGKLTAAEATNSTRLAAMPNIAVRASSVAQISPQPFYETYNNISTAKLWRRSIIIAIGTELHLFDLDSETRSWSDVLPLDLESPVTAIDTDENNIWLGTTNGVVHFNVADGTAREYGEGDGFPAASVSALCLAGDRLFIGFSRENRGSIGYLDTTTGKFTNLAAGNGLQPDPTKVMQKTAQQPVTSITTGDKKGIWISSSSWLPLQHFDSNSNLWQAAMPVEFRSTADALSENEITANSRYLVVRNRKHCILVCRSPGTQWSDINLSTNSNDEMATAIALDPSNPDWLWLGGSQGRLTLLDLATTTIVAQGQLEGESDVKWIFPKEDKVIFIANRFNGGDFALHWLRKSSLTSPTPSTRPTVDPVDSFVELQFLQKNFARFVPVQLQKGTNGAALIQPLQVRQNMFRYGNRYYCGVRFTVPDWIDGDVECVNVLAKTEAQKDFTARHFEPLIIPQAGKLSGFTDPTLHSLDEFPPLKRLFPYTGMCVVQDFDRGGFQPGKSYAFLIRFDDTDLPDLGIAITIDSERGKGELGALPLRESAFTQ